MRAKLINSIKLAGILSILLTAVTLHAASPTANDILSKMRVATISKPSMDAVFTINGGEGPVQGNATISGQKFTMVTPQISVWFDGKTQWTFLESSGEVSITEPDAAEQMTSNPFSILSAHADFYNARRLSDSQGRFRIELAPNDKSTGIDRIIVFVSQKSYLPEVINVRFSDKRAIDIVIDKISNGGKKPVSFFQYDSKRKPATEIIDLR